MLSGSATLSHCVNLVTSLATPEPLGASALVKPVTKPFNASNIMAPLAIAPTMPKNPRTTLPNTPAKDTNIFRRAAPANDLKFLRSRSNTFATASIADLRPSEFLTQSRKPLVPSSKALRISKMDSASRDGKTLLHSAPTTSMKA